MKLCEKDNENSQQLSFTNIKMCNCSNLLNKEVTVELSDV